MYLNYLCWLCDHYCTAKDGMYLYNPLPHGGGDYHPVCVECSECPYGETLFFPITLPKRGLEIPE